VDVLSSAAAIQELTGGIIVKAHQACSRSGSGFQNLFRANQSEKRPVQTPFSGLRDIAKRVTSPVLKKPPVFMMLAYVMKIIVTR
jgi:hypothetical protein